MDVAEQQLGLVDSVQVDQSADADARHELVLAVVLRYQLYDTTNDVTARTALSRARYVRTGPTPGFQPLGELRDRPCRRVARVGRRQSGGVSRMSVGNVY